MLNKGLPEVHVETRCYNAKLNTELNDVMIELGLGGQWTHVMTKIGKVIYPDGINVFDKAKNVTNPNQRRDKTNFDQMQLTQLIESDILNNIFNHAGKLEPQHLMKYTNEACEKGCKIRDVMLTNCSINVTIHTNQSSLEDYYLN